MINSENSSTKFGDNINSTNLVEQRQAGFIVVPSEMGDTTPDEYPNGGPLDVASIMDDIDTDSNKNPFINGYFGQMIYNTSDNSFYFWSNKTNAPAGGWKKLI